MPLWELSIEIEPERADALGAALLDAGAGGFEERPDQRLLVLWTDSAEMLATLEGVGRRFGAEVAVRECDDSWRTEWTRYLVPERVSEGFVLQPLGDRTAAPDAARIIWYRPELAFGVGSHPTTRLAATALERLCRERPKASLLDVGCGTGVLAFVGVLSGAAHATGIDIDPVAVSASLDNARLNDLAERTSFSTTPIAELETRHDLVVANLEAPTQLELAADLASSLEERGLLIVTGFLRERRDEILAALGLRVIDETEDEGWSLVVLGR